MLTNLLENLRNSRFVRMMIVIITLVVVVVLVQQFFAKDKHADFIASGNGRIEATEIDVAADRKSVV